MYTLAKQLPILLFLTLLTFTTYAQTNQYSVGTHYLALTDPVETQDPTKIEVVEAFWYGCIHCFQFEPLLLNWVSGLPDDVNMVLFPAQWSQVMRVHSLIYYISESLLAESKINQEKFEELHEAAFSAIHLDGNSLLSAEQITDLFVGNGVDENDFTTAFTSTDTLAKVSQGDDRMLEYQVRSTPSMIVNGKYLVSTGPEVATHEEMLEVVDFLIEKERQALESNSQTDDDWPYPYSGVTPDVSLGLGVNNISALNPEDQLIYACVNILLNGLQSTYDGVEAYDIAFEILSSDEGSIRVEKVRPFNPGSALNENGEYPDCSGELEVSTFTYIDTIQAGSEVYNVQFELTDEANLTFRVLELSLVGLPN